MPVEDVASAVVEWKARAKPLSVYRDYHRGNHQLRFATRDFEKKYGDVVKSLRENLCPPVVSAYADKVTVEKWGDLTDDEDATVEGLDRLLGQVTRETFRCGNAYVLVWQGPDGKPNAHYHRADAIIPHVNPLDSSVLDWAAKVWFDTATRRGRVNVYYADRVERYATATQLAEGSEGDLPETVGGWIGWSDDDGPDTIRHTFGAVPVCWFKRDADSPEAWGQSILADVIPLQDGLNTSLAHMVVTGEAYAKPFWYLLNFQPTTPGNPLAVAQEYQQALGELQALNEKAARRFDPTAQRIFTHDGPGPFGQLDPPDLTHLLKVQDGFAQKIARVSGVPSYYLSQTSGDVPSGESLRVLSSRLTSGVAAFTREAAPVWRGFKQLMGMDDTAPRFADPMPLTAEERLALAQEEQALGLPPEIWLRTAGYDPAETDAAGVTLADQVRQHAATSTEALGAAFRNGDIPADGGY